MLHSVIDPRRNTGSQSRLSRLLAPTNVVVGLAVTSKKRLFEQAGLLFENNQGIERSKVFDSLFARERLGSTGLGSGVAIPHGRIKGLRDAVAAVVRLAEPLPFDAPDGQPVGLLVFLLVPEHATDEHLELLSELAEMLSNDAIRESLISEPDPARVHQILSDWHPCRPAA
jgi:nitrogen PTS system EIIA component